MENDEKVRAGTLKEMRGANVEVEKVGDLSGADLENFMHEEVVIRVHSSPAIGSVEVLTPNVNGINQPVIRGVDQAIKRKYVEAMARAHTITYEQRVLNPHMPENISMVERKTPDYPFEVVQDTPRGKKWLAGIRASI